MERVKYVHQPYALICIRSYMGCLPDLIYSFSQTEAHGGEVYIGVTPKFKDLEKEMCKHRF